MRSFFLFPNRSILCIRATIGDRNWSDRNYCLGRGVAGLRVKEEKLDRGYLWHWLGTAQNDLLKKARGSTFKQVDKSALQNLEIPLPPIAEQQRISAILDKADAIRRKRSQSIALTEALLRSAFLDMFDSSESSEWETVTVEDVASPKKGSIRTGPFGSQLLHSEFVEEGIAVLGIDNAVQNRFNWAKARFITEDKYKELSRYTVFPGDVLITIMGTCGRCAIVPDNFPKAINTKHLCCITLDHEKCLPDFLHYYFLIHPKARLYLEKNAKGAIMDGLNMSIIKDLPVPLVPLHLQQYFRNLAQSHVAAIDKLRSFEEESNQLFSSLLQLAFRGEL